MMKTAPLTFMLVGPVGGGKTTLFKALYGRMDKVRKTQAIEFEYDGNIDSPGEFINIPRMYHAFIQISSDIDTIVYVHPSNEMEFCTPPGLLFVYPNKRHIAVISKVDLTDAQPSKVEVILRANGFSDPIFQVSEQDKKSISILRNFLKIHPEKQVTHIPSAHSALKAMRLAKV